MSRAWILAPFFFSWLGLAGCDSPPPVQSCENSSECEAGRVCVDGMCVAVMDAGPRDGGSDAGQDGGPPPELVSLAIVPADPVIVSADGAMEAVDFELEGTYSDGSTATLSAGFWSLEGLPLGTMDSTTGLFTANGELGGTATVQVDAFDQTVTTTVRVELERTLVGEGVPADVADRFAGPPVTDPGRAAGLLYPLDGTVFPQNVYPPDVQWERGADGDLYRIRIRSELVRMTAYVLHSGAGFRYDWPVDRDSWLALAESSPEVGIELVVDRWEASTGELIAGAPRTFELAAATIRGAIYYWDLGGGRIQRIRGDGTGRESFMPNPPARPSDGRRCVACHTVSRDGTRMAAELWDGGDFGAVFDLTVDLSGDPAPTVVPPSVNRFLTASFSPDNQRLVANQATRLFLMDGNTGASLPALGAGLPGAQAAHPSWSPDGASIAFASNHNGGWGVDFTRSNLGIIPVTGPDTFGAPEVIYDPAAAGSPYVVVARPSWSPDSQWIAVQNSQHSRAYEDPGAAASILREGVLRLVRRSDGQVVDLSALNGGEVHNFYPTFSPFDEGGYFWLAFFSTRDYGNAQAGTRGTNRRQLWVAAISNRPEAGLDPSRAPYWLPQQDVSHENMAAFWSEEPCYADGRACSGSGECCSGFCRDTGGGPICVPEDEVECSELGEACRDSSDCCEGAGTCLGGRCDDLG